MKPTSETYLYLHELRDLWNVSANHIRHWKRDGLLPGHTTVSGLLFHKNDIANFARKHASLLRAAVVEKEVENIRKTQMAFEFSTLIHNLESPFGETYPTGMAMVIHTRKFDTSRLKGT
jgi:hypothetical protein